MPVDGCTHSFKHLANVVLPAHMKRMREAMKNPVAMRTFLGEKNGPATIAKAIGLPGDFSGCYVLMDRGQGIYSGISRKVLSRLRQHVGGKSHNDASLAYAVAKREEPHKLFRGKAMRDEKFAVAFERAKQSILKFDVAFIEIDCPVELYGFELYCSMELDTDQWNTFRTH
jgi:predicted GIY-YIG superfamily endonuclease